VRDNVLINSRGTNCLSFPFAKSEPSYFDGISKKDKFGNASETNCTPLVHHTH
jgi:hypothetical protein